ncbi:MAG: sulfotransferase domain-containing protein [Chloroflexota bacterium]|nr:sulfotransferase domain-containing protein [Chloroflexota bacterium]
MKKLFRNLRKSKPSLPVIVVSGLPRSGTSMMMKMLEAGGLTVVTDQIRTADEDNPKGYYEFERVKQLDKGDTSWVSDAQGKVVKVISALLEHLPPDYDYNVIFLQRSIEEVLASQKRMLERRGEPTDRVSDEEMARLFAKHTQKVDLWLNSQPNISVLYVDYNEVVSNPHQSVGQANRFLGGHLDEQAMISAVDPQLYRNRANLNQISTREDSLSK